MILATIPFIIALLLLIPYTKNIIENLIFSLITTECVIFVSIFFLSISNSLSFSNYRIIWLIICIIFLLLLMYILCKKRSLYIHSFQHHYLAWKERALSFKVISICFLVFFVLISCISIITIPYNYDSMTYHLARISHWIQNGNTLPYATSVDRQIFSPVLSEYTIMHTILLHGNDQFANYIQGFSYICNVILVYGLTRKLNLSRNLSFFSAFLYAMSPMALAQAFSTQTEEFATLWLLCFMYLIIDLFECKHITLCKQNILKVVALSLSLMLGYHSKPTVCIIMFITLVALLGKALKAHDKIKDLVCLLLLAIGVIFIFFIPEFINNLHLYGSIFSSSGYGHIVIATTDIRYYILNFYKNFSYMFTSEIFPAFDNFLVTTGISLAGLLGISIDDPLISVAAPFTFSEDIYHHDTASYFVFMTLCTISLFIYLVLLILRKKKLTGFQLVYGAISFLSFFILLAITKWSPWKCRYFISNMAILIPFIVLILKQILSSKKILQISCIAIFSVLSLFYGVNSLKYHGEYFKNSLAELDDRNEIYYIGRIDYKWPMQLAVEYITQQGIGDIGLLIGSNTYEYPIWESFDDSIRIEHIDVANSYLHTLEHQTFNPKYIIVLEDARYSFQPGDEYVYNNVTYICSNIFENKVQLLEIK